MRYTGRYMLLLLLQLPLLLLAQLQPNYYIFNRTNGLQSNVVYNIHKAANGLLYVAHEKGLSSFDGRNFIDYPNRHSPFAEMTNIIETSNGKLFCKRFNNSMYELSGNNELEFVAQYASDFGFRPAASNGRCVYNMTNDTLVIFDAATRKQYRQSLQPDSAMFSGKVVFLGVLRYGKDDYYACVNEQNKIGYMPAEKYKGYNWHMSNGSIFGGQKKSLRDILYLNTGELIHIENPDNAVVNYISCTDSNIWICTTDGLYFRKRKNEGGIFTHLLDGYNTTSVAELNNNGIVAGTIGYGLIYIPNFQVRTYASITDKISSMTRYGNELLLGTKGGKIIKINTDADIISPAEKYSDAPISFLLRDNSVSVTECNGIVNRQLGISSIKDYCKVGRNYLFATANGVFMRRADNAAHWLQRFVEKESYGEFERLLITKEYTTAVAYDEVRDKLFLSNHRGVFEIDGSMKAARQLPELNCVLKDITVYKGRLLLATKDKGLLEYDGRAYVPARSAADVGSILYKLLVYRDELWVLGEDALYCILQDKVQEYRQNVGLNPSEIQGFCVDSANVFVQEAGTVIRFPKNILTGRETQSAFILHGVTDGKTALADGGHLQATHNSVHFLYSYVSLGNAENGYAAYSVNGGEKIALPRNRNRLELNYLTPDKYTLQFFVVEKHEARPVAAFHFEVVPRFYSTVWFYLLLLLLMSVLFYWFSKRRTRKMQEGYELRQAKLMLERELDKSMLTSIKAQMNPHFLFNALNTTQSYVYMNDKQNAGVYISKFSELTRSILDHSSKEYVTLAEELSALRLYLELEKMRFEGVLQYDIFVAEEINVNAQYIAPMLLQPYVENAVKHGLFHKKQNRQLKLRFLKKEGGIRIEIEDNGIGRKRSEEINSQRQSGHRSFSMNANRKRLEILKQYQQDIYFEIIDLYSSLQEPLGTMVVIELPHRPV